MTQLKKLMMEHEEQTLYVKKSGDKFECKMHMSGESLIQTMAIIAASVSESKEEAVSLLMEINIEIMMLMDNKDDDEDD